MYCSIQLIVRAIVSEWDLLLVSHTRKITDYRMKLMMHTTTIRTVFVGMFSVCHQTDNNNVQPNLNSQRVKVEPD